MILDVPGIIVTIASKGELDYLRGFDYQDIQDGVWIRAGRVGNWSRWIPLFRI